MKLIASDFDCTLSFGGVIPEQNQKAVQRWRAAGNQFVIVTGRPYMFAVSVITESHAECDALIACNGGMFIDRDCRITHKRMTDPTVLPPLTDLIFANHPTLVVFSAGGDRIEYSEDNGEVLYHPEEEGFVIPPFLTEKRPFAQICVCFRTDAEARDFSDLVNRTFSDKLDAKANGGNCDITPFGVQKPLGIRDYIKTLPEQPEMILTVGDNFNDLSMLQAYRGHAIAGSQPRVVEAAQGRTVADIADLVDRYL